MRVVEASYEGFCVPGGRRARSSRSLVRRRAADFRYIGILIQFAALYSNSSVSNG